MSTDHSYGIDQLVDEARAELDGGPAHVDTELLTDEARFWRAERGRVRWSRTVALGGAGLLAACLTVSTRPVGDAAFSLTLLTFLAVGVGLCGASDVRAQVVARASLWALAMLGCGVWLLFMPNDLQMMHELAGAYRTPEQGGVPGVMADLLAALVPLGALLVLGMQGLERPAERGFRPVAFRRLIALSLVLGLADAIWLLTLGLVNLLTPFSPPSAVPWVLVLGLLSGAWGLYRLRAWGLAVMSAANVIEVVLLLRSPEVLLGPELMILIITAAVQVLLPIPVYAAMLRGRAETSERAERIGRRVPTVVLWLLVIAVLVKWSVVMALI